MNLRQYWNSQYPSNNRACSTWLIQQCHGIAEALSGIHRYNTTSGTSILHSVLPQPLSSINRHEIQANGADDQKRPRTLFGRHGDITPANVLWFPDQNATGGYGILKISDFGTARFSNDETLIVEDKDSMPRTDNYRSPQWGLPDGKLSVQCDVWALGCMFLEYVCWYVGGYKLLEEFENQRVSGYESGCFFSIEMLETPGKPWAFTVDVKRPVKEMLEELRSRSATNSGILSILSIVQNDMLVAQSNDYGCQHEMNKNESRRIRKSSGNIARELSLVVQNLNEQ
ncbi:hypothetical protein GQ44DRAFT_775464 [Phaeosphaeriaceae sp. PMI808]|nr:hypothetical protein GQ44DRAFT_775464 [Phaeosphaeriaceae sp. PMI808]